MEKENTLKQVGDEISPKYTIMARRGNGHTGRRISLLANHFKVSLNRPDAVFYQYSVSITSEDKREVNVKAIGRKIIEKLYETYSSEFSGKRFAYDGEKSLYTVGSLPHNKSEFTVLLEESFAKNGKRLKRSFGSKTFIVELSYAAKVPLKPIALALKGTADEDNSAQDALRVLDTILRQQAAKRKCLLVWQSFFHDDSKNFSDVGGGVIALRGFHSSFRATQNGLSLNMDVSSTMILKPGPVTNFLKENQGVRENRFINWWKAKRMLKNMIVKTKHLSMEFKIIGLSDKPCNELYFPLKVKTGGDVTNEEMTRDITVYKYFKERYPGYGTEIAESANLPCLVVGRPKSPSYLPLELCLLVSLQRYAKELSSTQRAALVEKSRQKPEEKMKIILNATKNYQYDHDPLLAACGISIEKQFTQVDGRILEPPKLNFGNGSQFAPSNGRWNLNNKTVFDPIRINSWIVVNFSARCDMHRISRDLINCGRNKGIRPANLIDEEHQSRRHPSVARVEKMFELIKRELRAPPEFILCILPERKNSDIYGPWKKKCLSDFGIVTQCISPFKINDQYLTNVLLKINSKLGGINSLLAIEKPSRVPVIKDKPTMIFGMDVSHGSPGRSDLPSIAAVVSSRNWPCISRYRASVRAQSPKLEMIDALYKPLENGEDGGIIKELLMDFHQTSNGRKPNQIIIFRDGVSESEFNQVLNIELDQIKKVYQHLEDDDIPKFTVIVAQKNHHTKLFQAGATNSNVPPGTIVDTGIVHPRNYDFYLCSHAGMIGTSRPVHYRVLLDEIGFSLDDLKNLIHSLSYVYQRSTTAVSLVAPICFAHLAAYQMGQFVKFDDLSETSSGQRSLTSESIPIPEIPKLHDKVKGSMFFC